MKKKTLHDVAAALLGGGALLGALACATARPSAELVSAREAYQAAETGPAKELNPADLHDAKVLLDGAEAAFKDDADSPAAKHHAYLALRRAELADAQGKTSAAVRQKSEAEKQVQAFKDQSAAKTRDQLSQVTAAQAQTQVQLAQTQGQLAQTKGELDAEHKSGAELHGQLADASAAQAQTQAQLKDSQAQAQLKDSQAQAQLKESQAQVDSEHQARLVAEKSALDALGKIAAVKQEARGMVITLSGSVLFASGKSRLLPGAEQRLDQVAQALATSDRTILIEGHSDSQGSPSGNQRLSSARAQAVLDYLVPRGIPAGRIHAVGLGASKPIADNATAEGRANNRRVEIVVETPH